jgi:hypothetical protein
VPGEICVLEHIICQIGAITLDKIRNETRRDGKHVTVTEAMRTTKCPNELSLYSKTKDELKFSQEILNRTGSIVVPAALRKRALDLGHSGHPGKSAMKTAMRERIWWPKLPKEIDEFVAK